MSMFLKHHAWKLAAAASGMTFLFGGCDPELRTTIENGIITSSSNFLGALFTAMIQLVQEQASTETARAVIEVAERIVA